MRELRVVGLDVDSRQIICESDDSEEKFVLRSDERLEAAVRGDEVGSNQTTIDVEAGNMLSPREIQAKIRSGASVEQVPRHPERPPHESSGSPIRCFWNANVPRSWPPQPIQFSPTGRQC